MRKLTVAVLLLAVILCGCGQKAPKLGPADMLDSDTGVIYHSAARIQADGSAARFSFFGFDFSKKLEDVEKRYEAHQLSDFDTYRAYYSKEGKSLEIHDAIQLQDYTEHTLFVSTKDRPDTGLKAGDYMFYVIERRTGYPQP